MLASNIADQLSFVHGTAIDDPAPLFALGLESLENSIELAQVIRNGPELKEIRRSFADEITRPVFELLNRARDKDESCKIVPRIERALRYLRKSVLETDPIDSFEDLSNGLQALEPRLQQKYGTSTTSQKKCESCKGELNCKACGNPVMAQDNFSGLDYVVVELLGRPPEEARRLRTRRNAIVHSFADLDSLLDGLADLSKLARAALMVGVLGILGASSELCGQLTRQALSIAGPPEIVVVAKLRGISLEKIQQQTNYPSLHLVTLYAVIQEDTDHDNLRALKIVVGITNFEGDWEPVEAFVTFKRDPEDSGPIPDLLLEKAGPSVPISTTAQVMHSDSTDADQKGA